MANGTAAQRRNAAKAHALALKAQVTAGTICDCEALARLSEFVASQLPRNTPGRIAAFVNDLSLVCAAKHGRNKNDKTYFVSFGQTCFKPEYQEPAIPNSPQVRHFVGFVLAGFQAGWALGFGSLIYNEARGTSTQADIWLGIKGIQLGNRIDSALGRVEIENVGAWIRKEVCGCKDAANANDENTQGNSGDDSDGESGAGGNNE